MKSKIEEKENRFGWLRAQRRIRDKLESKIKEAENALKWLLITQERIRKRMEIDSYINNLLSILGIIGILFFFAVMISAFIIAVYYGGILAICATGVALLPSAVTSIIQLYDMCHWDASFLTRGLMFVGVVLQTLVGAATIFSLFAILAWKLSIIAAIGIFVGGAGFALAVGYLFLLYVDYPWPPLDGRPIEEEEYMSEWDIDNEIEKINADKAQLAAVTAAIIAARSSGLANMDAKVEETSVNVNTDSDISDLLEQKNNKFNGNSGK